MTNYCGKTEIALKEEFRPFSTVFPIYLYLQESIYIFRFEMRLLDLFFTQLCKFDLSRSRSISESPMNFEITRANCTSFNSSLNLTVHVFVCFAVVRPSQLIRIMSSAVSLSDQTISGRFSPLRVNQYLCTCFCQKLITVLLNQRKGEKNLKNIS